MTIQEMRNRIKQAYSNSPIWSKKVDQMSEAQVVAIHARLVLARKVK